MIYQGNNDYRDFLMHYGVKGMKWHKRKAKYNEHEPKKISREEKNATGVKKALSKAVMSITVSSLAKKLSTKRGKKKLKKTLAEISTKSVLAITAKKLSSNQGIKRGERVPGSEYWTRNLSGNQVKPARNKPTNSPPQRKKTYTTGTGIKRGEKRKKKTIGRIQRKVFYDN